LGGIQLFAFDFTGFDHILGKGVQRGFFTQREAQGFHAPEQPALQVTHFCQQFGQLRLIPFEFGPVFSFVNIHGLFFALLAEIMAFIRRTKCGD
jgi:hypothetical protein